MFKKINIYFKKICINKYYVHVNKHMFTYTNIGVFKQQGGLFMSNLKKWGC